MAKFSPTYWSIYFCGKRTWLRCYNVYAIQCNSELLVEGFSHACQIQSVEICLKKMFRKMDGESSGSYILDKIYLKIFYTWSLCF